MKKRYLAFSAFSLAALGSSSAFAQTGNVGIGIAAPTSKLHIVGNATATPFGANMLYIGGYSIPTRLNAAATDISYGFLSHTPSDNTGTYNAVAGRVLLNGSTTTAALTAALGQVNNGGDFETAVLGTVNSRGNQATASTVISAARFTDAAGTLTPAQAANTYSVFSSSPRKSYFAGDMGIGTATPGTRLDVDGALTLRQTQLVVTGNAATIPANVSQVELTGAATGDIALTAPAVANAGQRIVIFNSTTGGYNAVLNGFIIPNGQAVEFYNNTTAGASFKADAAALSTAWLITGNAGLSPVNNFIGTTDNVPFNIRVNNLRSGIIESGTNANTGFGFQSGISNTTGVQNVGFGAFTLQQVTTGSRNTAMGWNAIGIPNTPVANTATDNTGVGYINLASVNTGSYNTGVGSTTLDRNTSGTLNTALGYQALHLNTTFSNNTSVGANAGYNNAANANTAVGSAAMFYNTTGANNTAVGYLAGTGTSAALSNLSGSGNTLIGAMTNVASTNLTNAAAIGANAFAGASNTMVLGAINGVNGAVSNTNVGIGTTTPTRMLQVGIIGAFTNSGQVNQLSLGSTFSPTGGANPKLIVGEDNIGNQYGIGVSPSSMQYLVPVGANHRFYIAGSEVVTMFAGGNVGIGNSSPSYRLDVSGDINASGSVRSGGVALTSDRRLKRNIVPSVYGLSAILALKPVQYEKKSTIQSNDYDRNEIGFIAQDIQKLIPSIVSVGKDADKTLAVSYTELIPVLTKAIQEQQAEIEALKAQNTKLTAQAADVAEMKTAMAEMRAELSKVVLKKVAGKNVAKK